MNQLIAVVATAVIVSGERIVIQPGERLPDLGEHDSQALIASGAALDPALDKQASKAVNAAALAAAASFQAARQRVQAESASTDAAQLEQPEQPEKTDPAVATKTAKAAAKR